MIIIEIDGVRERFDAYYEDSPFYPCGSLWGFDEKTKGDDQVRNYESTNCVWPLAAYRINEDGSYFGIQGLFAHGGWAKDEKGGPLYRVWDRVV